VVESIKKLAGVLGIIIGVSTGVIVILLLLLYLYSKIKRASYRKALKKEFEEAQRKTIGMGRRKAM
jgi:ABC-type antimicrobial peptide transport system permease subunit